MKRSLALLLSLLSLLPLSACARSANLVDVQVVDLDAGNTLPRWPYRGREYLEGQPGHRFSVTLQNLTGERVLAVLSVDGVNAISGQTASAAQSGYVLEPWQRVEIRGWRKNYSEVAEFYFTDLPDSYAARTGRAQNVGVVGVAAFRERRYEPTPYYPAPSVSERDAGAPAPYARGNASAASDAAAEAPSAARSERRATAQQIGTGHGERRYDPVTQTVFERESSRPNQVVSLFYDSTDALADRGVIPSRGYRRDGRPDPFPVGFVPDPPRW
ncbi:hypothetical protein [Arenimonas oryziterrae]|uniref:Uncharacterized protein n=1 Tax=Arenimonas oryziterrae DSM 21050 = YC6267 TaxID=1121015 RepID=A0A091ATY2_9GAMM|nr:hypothetical protein [Arenimonas oryziterrae]KFN42642.1 hypothetical protein N789_13455 [Arenimonas oryziterrae DSM 21050 = YC6267]